MLLVVLVLLPITVTSWVIQRPQWPLSILKEYPFLTPQGIENAHHDRLGAVASENKLCSQIGIDILNAGGNAADALVGTVFCIGVVDCHHSGLGGGGFALARSSNGSYESVDFREAAPGAAHKDMFKHNILGSIFGGLSR